MDLTVASVNSHSGGQLIRTLERLFEDAQITGELKLSGKKLKEFPKVACKYDLNDTVQADLSKNRFNEVPSTVCEFYLLERLNFYHNAIRSIPDSVITLHSLTYLDLSRNQLLVIPPVLCQLPLQVLILSNNKLVSLPEEIGHMQCLMDLDVSCNEISVLPPQIGDLHALCSLNVRRNLLAVLPAEICELRLTSLDISANRISVLPHCLRLITSLRHLMVDQNPLTSPPAILCARGKVHIFKFLELQANKEEKKSDLLLENDLKRLCRKPNYLVDLKLQSDFTSDNKVKRCTIDSGYNTSDGGERRQSQEIQDLNTELEETKRCNKSIELNELISSKSGRTQNSFVSSESANGFNSLTDRFESQAKKEKVSALYFSGKYEQEPKYMHALANCQQEVDKRHNSTTNLSCNSEYSMSHEIKHGSPSIYGESKRPYPHIQTYKEFKEALRLQRAGDGSIYRKPVLDTSNSLTSNKCEAAKVEIPHNSSNVPTYLTPEQEFRIRHETLMSQQRHEAVAVQRHLESEKNKEKQGHLNSQSTSSSPLPDRQIASVNIVDRITQETATSANSTSQKVQQSVDTIHPNFTMRRELDKAREEQELINQLREIMETKLGIVLPEDLGSALKDGVLLCHLANLVLPSSVISVHVPSSSVPKLTMAKCRKNVENFLEACHSSGVPEAQLFSWEQLVLKRHVLPVSHTVQELIYVTRKRSSLMHLYGDMMLSFFLVSTFIGICCLICYFPP